MSTTAAWVRRYGLWAFPLLGALVVLHTIAAWHRGHVRTEFIRTNHYGIDDFGIPIHRQEIDRIAWLARREGAEIALAACEGLRHSPTRKDGIERLIALLKACVRIRCLQAPDVELTAFLGEREPLGLWWLAVEQLLNLRKARQDLEGARALLESLVDGRLRHPVMRDMPFPYAEQWAAVELARLHSALGDGRRAHVWALRAKTDLAIDFPSFCGDPLRDVHADLEGLLQGTALQAGICYAPEPFELARWIRRIYGPGWEEGVLRIAAGLILAAVGGILQLLRKRHFRWEFFWKRRGPWAKFGLGVYLLNVMGVMVLVVKPLLKQPFPPDDGSLFAIGFLSFAYTALFIPFVGCFIAENRAIIQALRRAD